VTQLTIDWPEEQNEHGGRLLWFGSWLFGDQGEEGPWFYTGRGGERSTCSVPAGASGLRIRRWPNEGLEAEYADLLSLEGVTEIRADWLDFDARQQFSRLPVDFT
jgi:hypothetical protein